MKKLFIVVFVLLCPAIAHAWTFSVNITNTTAGIAAGNQATVTVASTSTVVTVGTKYFYPDSTVTSVSVAVANLPNVQSITLDNVPVLISSPVVVSKGTANSHILRIVYSSAASQTRNITVAQGTGGLTTIKIGRAASTVGFTGVAVGTPAEVVVQPNSGYRLLKITVNGQDDASGGGSTLSVTKSFAVDGAFSPNTVSAVFDMAPKITASLATPSLAVAGTLMTAECTATSNLAPLVYAFTTDCSAESQTGASRTFSFTPAAAGTCSVSVTVSHTETQTFSPQVTKVVSIISASAEANWTCTNCHAGNTPQIVDGYNRSAHNGNAGSSCLSCHVPAGTSLSPHYAQINAQNINAASFQVLTSNVISGRNKGDVFCSGCHTPTIAADFASSAHAARAGATSCSFCHAGGVHDITPRICVNCHTPVNPYGLLWPPPRFTFHTAYTGTTLCTNCHAIHNPAVMIDTQDCTGCHSVSTPQIVEDYNRSAHKATVGFTCSSCHTPPGSTLHAHHTNINSTTISVATFQVMTGNVISGLNKGDTFCSLCHSPKIAVDFASGPHSLRAGASACGFCHTGGVHDVTPKTCADCHSAKIFTDFASSRHSVRAGATACGFCHTGGAHDVKAKACTDCHTSGNSYGLVWPPPGFAFHNAYTGTNVCTDCHNMHNPAVLTGIPYPHFSSFTTAQYVTANISCDHCHSSSADAGLHIYPASSQWAQSGKANPTSRAWTAYDFKTRGTPGPATPATTTGDDCVRCHTTTGYVNYVGSAFTDISPWGSTEPGGDRTREMIACNACHSAPFTADFARRRVGVNPYLFYPQYPARHVVAWYGYSSAGSKKVTSVKIFDDNGDSNICIACHSGKNAGENIKEIAARVGMTGAFWQNVDFISPHYKGSAGILSQDSSTLQTGYEFREVDAYDPPVNFAHPAIGDGNHGPCVGCHMTGSVKKHLFTPLSTASNGVIAAITSTTCGGCHGASGPLMLDAASMQRSKEGYQAALGLIAALLQDRGVYYAATVYPYFFTTADPAHQTNARRTLNWDAGAPTFKGADVMGAAFNLKLLQSDGGCWVHNSAYTKRLLYDTVDFLDDGNPNNSSVAVAVQNASITQDAREKVLAYIGVRP